MSSARGGYKDAGFTPVHVWRTLPQTVDLMLIPKNASFRFANARWSELAHNHSEIYSILSSGAPTEAGAQARYEGLMENRPAALACLWNLLAAMRDIDLPTGTLLTYSKQLIWTDVPERDIFAPKQDRFYAYADRALIDQVQRAAQQKVVASELDPHVFHKGATSSYKQIEFGEANVQLTFHENDTAVLNGVDCIVVEPDIDYYKDLGAHALLEVFANTLTGSLTDPRDVYVLRWMAGRQAGVPEFIPAIHARLKLFVPSPMNPGDVAVYVSPHKPSKFDKQRYVIKRSVFDVMAAVYSAQTPSASKPPQTPDSPHCSRRFFPLDSKRVSKLPICYYYQHRITSEGSYDPENS